MGVQPRISAGGGGRQGGGVRAIPSPKRCSPRRLGLANSYSAVAGWACGTERPDMAADPPAAPARGAAPAGAAAPLQLPQSPSALGGGGGVYTTQNSAEPGGGGAGSARVECVTRAAWTPVPSAAHSSAVTGAPPGEDSWGSWLRSELGRGGWCRRPRRDHAETLPKSLHVFHAPLPLLSGRQPALCFIKLPWIYCSARPVK